MKLRYTEEEDKIILSFDGVYNGAKLASRLLDRTHRSVTSRLEYLRNPNKKLLLEQYRLRAKKARKENEIQNHQ